jgi:putative ABC transport system substrate-binding protein
VRRRDFIIVNAAAVALSFSASAQQPAKIWRIGDVLTVPPEQGEPFAQALERSLANLGYVQGRNIVLLHRFAGARVDKLEEAITSLLPQIDILVVWEMPECRQRN